MDDRESSVASSYDFYEPEARPKTPASLAPADAPVAKRKAQDFPTLAEKKRKLDSPAPSALSTELRPCARLPPAVWQHVFLFSSLADLGRLIQVNRAFHSYLTDVRCVSTQRPPSGCLRLVKSESLWASARNALPSKPPKPLPGFSELHMWQLAWSKRCQFCNQLKAFTPGSAFWQKGPGPAGVRTIWPFGIKACGPCLLQQCKSDMSLLFSSISAIRHSLAFALITNDHHYVAAYTAQLAHPANVEIGKYYHNKHVDEVAQELNDALCLGPAAAEEWCKGLETREKEWMRMAENWERWEVRHQYQADIHELRRATPAARSTAASHTEPSTSPKRQARSPVIHAPIPASKYYFAPLTAATSSGQVQRSTNTPPAPNLTAAAANSHYAHQRPPTVPPQVYTPQPALTGSAQPNQQRNLHDANEAKATRRTDIERRCQQMDPPIPPTILRHMDSFKAAIQISQPMTDYAWNMLQPRLIAQLPAAQQAEADHVSRVASLPSKAADRRHPDVSSKEAKEAMDREWEESQRPIRDRLSAIADECIKRDWDNGNTVSHENSSKFAADLLKHVRCVFYTEEAAIQEPQNQTKLVLENMKWVYDNKIKPLTEQFRKELFMCHSSDCESGTRLYGFEGVVQHFGAKHTSAFSVGNVVVAWREAEWPEDTPFHPDPLSVKHTHHASSNTTGYGGYHSGFSRAGTSTPHVPAHMSQASPGPYQYGGHYNGPFAPPQASSAGLNGFHYSQAYAPTPDGQPHQQMGPPGYGVHPGNHTYIPSPAMANTAVAPLPNAHPSNQTMSDMSLNGVEDTSHRTGSFDKEVSTIIRIAPTIWKQTAGIKDMFNSLRVYILLHHVIQQFLVEFNREPSLGHFIDALSNHDIPKALKNAQGGLSCKACQAQTSHQLIGAHYSKAEPRTYTVLNLFTHFRAQHLAHHPGPNFGPMAAPLDWKEDMIELPNDRIISGLIHAPGMDDEKLLLIARIFPNLFPMPLPKIGKIDSNGMASPVSGPKDARSAPRISGTPTVSLDRSESAAGASPHPESPLLAKMAEDQYDPLQPGLPTQAAQAPGLGSRKRSYRSSPPLDRRELHYADSRYYVSREQLDDDYRPREYMEYAPGYAPSPRVIHAGPAYDDYSGRRTGFQEHERAYGPPQEGYVYAHPREGDYDREFGVRPRQTRYYEDGQYPGYRYLRKHRSREASPPRGESAADRFLEDFVPGTTSANDAIQPPPPPRPDSKPPVPTQDAEDGTRFPLPAPGKGATDEMEAQRQSLAALRPDAPSTVSNGSRYEEPHSNGHHVSLPDPGGPLRRSGPDRRRHRPHEQRQPSRYYRYASVAREDPYRAPSISRSQSRRYEEQRRRIDQQETPAPGSDGRYDPRPRSRDASVDQHDELYPPGRQLARDYVSVQDRLPHFSPPRYRVDEAPVYVDEYGYEIVRMRGDHRQPRRPYMAHAPAARYEHDHYPYVPVPYERAAPQRYEARPSEYVYYEGRQREHEHEHERALPRRAAFEPEPEALQPGIKVEGATPGPGLAGDGL